MKRTFTQNSEREFSFLNRQMLISLQLCFILFMSTYYVKAQTSEPYNWDNVDIGGGGFVSAIITNRADPSLMYARTDVGGAYRFDRANSKWIPLLDWASDQEQGMFGTESLASDPSDPKNLYIAAGISYFNSGKSFILRSFDYGATFDVIDVSSKFKFHGNGMGRQNGEKLQVDPNKNGILFCGTRDHGLWKSSDFGKNWTATGNLNVSTPNGNGISFVAMDKSSATVGNPTLRMFVGISREGSHQNLYRSNDGGVTFSAIDNTALPDTYMPQRAVLSGDGFMYVTYGNGAGPHGGYAPFANETYVSGAIWKYNISTGAWTNVTPISSTNRIDKAFCGISVDPNNPNRLIASTTNTYFAQGNAFGDRFYYSENGGSSWIDIVARSFSKDNNGVTWVANSSIHWAGSIEFDLSNTKRVWVTSGNGIFSNEDITTSGTWKFQVNGLEETVATNIISIPGGPLISVIKDYDGFRHTDVNQYAPMHSPNIGSTYGLAYGGSTNSKIVRAGTTLYYSNDMGLTWTKAASDRGDDGAVAVSKDGNIILYSPAGKDTTFISNNNGSGWGTVYGLNINSAIPVSDGATNGTYYAYNPSTGSFMVSSNGGWSFGTAATNPGSGGSKLIRTVPGRAGHVWIALKAGGLKYTESSGASFTTVSKVSFCESVGIGKAASGAAYETIYIYGTVDGVLGIHRSIDKGLNWTRVNDDDHEYGGPANGDFVIGDMNTYGRVYMSTAGRGIVFGSSQTCTPTSISPWTQINGGSWVATGTATLAAGGTVKFGPQPVVTSTWNWRGPNNFKATGRELTISNVQAANAGTYTATYTNSSGCKSSFQFKIVLSTGGTAAIPNETSLSLNSELASEQKNVGLIIYPNPVENKVIISVPEDFVGAKMVLTNASGIIVFGGTLGSATSLDMTGMPPGIYIFNARANGKNLNSKIIKK